MEKLIELINKYKEEKNIFNTDMDGQLEIGKYIYVNYPCAERLCSKKYGFIERLVENDKIKWRDKTELYYNISCYDWDGGEYELIGPNFTDTEQIIMILSIQDNPIEYLCSILKE